MERESEKETRTTMIWFGILCVAAVHASILPEDEIIVNSRIVTGFKVSISQYPWQVVLARKGYEGTFCGGSIVADDAVMTAAHCFADPITGALDMAKLMTTEVISGTDDLNNEKGNRTGLIEVQQPGGADAYNPKAGASINDILILKTRGKMAGQKIQMPLGNDYTGVVGYASGFGHTSFRGKQSQHLMAATVKIQPDVVCQRYYGPQHRSDKTICASAFAGKGLCHGDSGGPLIVYEEDGTRSLAGIASAVHVSGCGSGIPDLYTRVAGMRPFILKSLFNYGDEQVIVTHVPSVY